jgi:hypothetical protein
MNFKLRILELKSIREIVGYWKSEDYISLLEELEYSDLKNSSPSELLELLEMAFSELKAHESAEILLRYKLKAKLNDGQIRNLSHVMTEDNESEDNANIELHYPLFNINQLLYKCYKGKFPYAKATQLRIELKIDSKEINQPTKEVVLKAVSKALSDRSPIVRLFEAQINGKQRFSDAEYIIWELHSNTDNQYTLITSDYWLSFEDINKDEVIDSIKFYDDRVKVKPI